MTVAEIKKAAVNSRVYWFASLESAIERGQLAEAAKAQQELARLGITIQVDFRRMVAAGAPHAQ